MFGSSAVYLNDQQLSIVNSNINENQKILACAGSGKTTTIICRIKFLVEKGVDPSKIWMTAFNIDAAKQIKEKLSLVMGKELSEKVKVNNIDKISKGLLCKFDANFQKKISLQSKEMEKMKEKFQEDPEEFTGLTESEFNRKGYYKIKDFTPMLLKYFKANQQVVHQLFDYFFFDEFQDVNPDEYEFLKYLAHQGVKVSVIGDDAQNIYSFRDSVVDIIQSQINKDIPNIKSYYLTTNYRSSPEIVHFANEVVKASEVLIKKQMLADKFSCEQKPLLKKLNSIEEQNLYVIDYIQQQIYQKQKNPEQIAVLCRNNRPLQILEDQIINYNKKQEFKGKQTNISPKPINYIANFTSENLNQNKESDENSNQDSENNKNNIKGKKNIKNEGKKTQRSLLNFMGSNQNPHFQKPITLSTIHKAKGLEWDVVILIHCNDEFFPGSSQIEEERRVFYVAVTRAKVQLLITYINNEQVFKLSRFVNQINAKYFEGDFQSQQEMYRENQLRMLKEKNENQQEIKIFEQQQKDEEDFITKDQIQSAKKMFNLEEILNYLDIQGQIKQKYYNKLNLQLEKELSLEFLENVNNFYKKQGGLKIESCNLPGNLGNWIVANNMHNVYYNFLRHFLIRAIIFQIYVNKNQDQEIIKNLKLMLINQEAETVLYIGGKEKNFTYIKDQKKYQQFSKSYEIFQCIDKEPLDIIEDIYRVSVMKYILQDKQMFIQREDILKNFMVQSNLLKNCYKKFVCKYIIENSLSSVNNLQEFKFGEQLEFQIDENMENYKNVYANLNKEKLQKFKNENNYLKLQSSMDLMIGNTLFIFQFINYQGLQFNDIVRLYFQIAILKIKNINKVQFVKIYNPLKGNVFTINVLKFYENHMEQFLNLIFEVQTTLIGQIIPQILSKQAQQLIKSKKNTNNNAINVRFEGIHDFEDSQSDNYQNENNDNNQFEQNEINNKIQQNQNLQRNLNKTVFQGFQSATQILQSQNQEKQQKLEEKNCHFKKKIVERRFLTNPFDLPSSEALQNLDFLPKTFEKKEDLLEIDSKIEEYLCNQFPDFQGYDLLQKQQLLVQGLIEGFKYYENWFLLQEEEKNNQSQEIQDDSQKKINEELYNEKLQNFKFFLDQLLKVLYRLQKNNNLYGFEVQITPEFMDLTKTAQLYKIIDGLKENLIQEAHKKNEIKFKLLVFIALLFQNDVDSDFENIGFPSGFSQIIYQETSKFQLKNENLNDENKKSQEKSEYQKDQEQSEENIAIQNFYGFACNLLEEICFMNYEVFIEHDSVQKTIIEYINQMIAWGIKQKTIDISQYLISIQEILAFNIQKNKRKIIQLEQGVTEFEFNDTDNDKNQFIYFPEKEGYILYSLNGKPKEYFREMSCNTKTGRFEIGSMTGFIPRQNIQKVIQKLQQIIFLAGAIIKIDDIPKSFKDEKITKFNQVNEDILQKILTVFDQDQKENQDQFDIDNYKVELIKQKNAVSAIEFLMKQWVEFLPYQKLQIEQQINILNKTQFLLEENPNKFLENIQQKDIMLLESGIIPIFYNIDFHLFRLYESMDVPTLNKKQHFQIPFYAFLNMNFYVLHKLNKKEDIIKFIGVVGEIFGTIYNLENLNEEWNNWYGYWGKLFDEELVLKKLFEKQEENSLENNVQNYHIIYFEKIMHYILMFIEINKPDEFLFPLRANYGKDLWNILERINSHVFETEKQIQTLMRFYKNYYFTVISEEKEANKNQLRFQSYKSQDFIKNNQNCQECKVGNITIQQDSEFNCKLCNTLYDEGKFYFQCENKCKDSQIICFNCSEVPCCEKCDEILEIKMNPLNNNENKFTCFDCQNEYEQLPSFYCPKDQRNKCVFCWQLRYLEKNQGIEITCPAQNCKEITKLEFYIPKDKEWCCVQCKQIAKKIKVARCGKCGSDICIDCVRPKLKYTDDTNYPILTKEFFQSKINFSGTSLPSLENLEQIEQKQKNSEVIQSQKQQKIYNQFFVQENIKTLKESENFGEDYLKQKVKEVVNNQLRNELFQKVGRKKYPNFMFEFELLLEMQSLEDLLLFSTPTMCLNNLEPNYGLQQAYEILQYYKKNYPINMEYPFICQNLELLKSLDSYKTKEERKAFLLTLNDKPQQLQQILDYQKFLQVLYLINFLVSFLPNQETSQIDKEMKTSFLEFYDFFNQQAYNFLVYLFTRVSRTNNKLQDLSENDIQINLDKFKIKFQVSDAYNLFELIIEKFQKFIEVYNKQKTGSVVGQIENSEHYSNILQLIRELPVNEKDNEQVSNYQLISFLMFQEKFRVVNFKKYKLYNFGGDTLNTDLLEKINYYLVQLKQKAIEYQSFKVIIEYFYHYSCGYLGQIYSCNLVEKNSKYNNEKDQQFFDELIKFEQKQLGKKQIELQNQEDYNEDGRGKGKYLQILSKEGNLKLQQYIRPYIFKIFLSTLNLFIFNDNNYDRQNFEKLLQQSGEEIFQIILQAQGKKDLEFKTVKQIIDSEYHSLNCDNDRNSSSGNPVCINKEDSDDNREQKSQIPDKNILYITIGYTEITFGSSDYKGLEVVTINETEVIDNQTVQKLEYEVRKIISEKIRNELQMEQVQVIHKEESSLGTWYMFINELGIYLQILTKQNWNEGDMQKVLFQFYQQLQDKGLLQINEKHEHKQKQKEEIQELIDKINYPNQGQEKINKTQKQQPSDENEKINGEEKEDENQKQERIENFELDAMKDNLKFLQDLEQLKSNVNISVPFLFNQLTNIKKEQQYLKQIELEASNKQIQEDNIIFQQYNVNDKDRVLQGELITAQSEDKLYLALGSKKGHFVYILDKLGNIIKECNLESVYRIKEKKQQLNQIFHLEFDKDCENLAIITQQSSFFFIWNFLKKPQPEQIELDNIQQDNYITIAKWSPTHPVLFMGTNNGIQVFFDKNTQQQSRLKELTKAIEYCDWNLEGQVFMIGMQEKRFCYTNYKAEKIWISNKTRDFNTIQYGGKKDGEITYFGTIITSDNQLKFLHFKGNSYKQDLLSSVEFQPKFGTIRMYQILPNSLVLTSLSKGYITAHDVEKKPKLLKSLQVFKGNIDYFCVDKSYSKIAVCSGNVIKIVDLDKFQELQTVYIKGESETNINKNVKTLYAAWGQDSNIIYHSTHEEFSVIIPKYEQQFMPEKCKNYLIKWLFQQYKNNLEFLLEILEKEEIKQILTNLFQEQYKYFIEDFKQDKGNFYKKIIQQDLLNVLDQQENKLQDVKLYENKEYWQNKKKRYPASQIVGSYLIYEQLLHKYYFNTPFYNISNKEQLDFNIYIQTLLSKEIEEKQEKYLSYFSNFQTNNCTEFIEYQQSLRNVFSLDLNNHFIQMMEHLDPYPKFNLEEIVPAFLVIWNKEKIYKKVQDPKKIKKRQKKNQKCYKRQFSSESEALEFIQKIKNKNQYYQFQLREEECDSYIINYCYIKDQMVVEEFIGGKKGDIVKNTSQFQIQKQNEHYKYYEQLSKTFKCQNISKNQDISQLQNNNNLKQIDVEFEPKQLYNQLVSLYNLFLPILKQIFNKQVLSELNIDPEAIEQWVNEGIFITNSLLLTEKELTQEKLRKHLQFIDSFPTICNSNYSVSLHQLFLSFTLQDLDMDFLKANLELIYKQKPQALSKGSFWSSFPAASLEVSQQILQYQYNLCIEDGQQFLGQVFEFPKTATYFESFITIGQMPEASSNLIFVVDYLIEKIINQIYKIQDKSNQVMVDILVIEQFIELIVNYPLITPTILKYKLKQGFKNKYFDIPAGTSFFKFLIIITPLCYNINKLLFNAFYMVPYYYEKIENKKKFQRQFKIDDQNNSEIEDIGEDLDDINSDEDEEKFLSSKDILRNKIFSQLVYLVEEILEKKKTQEWTKKDIVFLKGYFNYLQPNLFDSIVHYKRIIRIYEKILEIYYHEPNKSKSNLLKKIDFLFPSNSFLKAIFDILLELKRSIFKSIPDTAGLGHQFLYYYYQKNLIQWTDELNEERKQKGLEQMIKEQREKDEKEIIEFSDEHKEIKNFRNEQLDFEMSKKAQKVKQQIINNNNNIFDKGQGYQGWKKGILFQIGMNNLCKKEELNVLFQTDMQENQELYNQVLDDFDFEFKEWEIEKNIDIFPEEYQKSLLRSKSDKLNKESEMFKLPIQFKYLIDYQYKKYEKKLQIYQEKEKRAKNNFLMDQDLNDQFQQNILEEQKQYEVNNNHYSFSSSNYELSDSEESYNSLSKQISEQNSDFNQSENNLFVGKQSQYMKQRSFIMDTHFLEDQQSLSSQQIDQFQDEQIQQKNKQIQQDLSKVLLMDRKLSKSEQIKVELIKFQEQKLLKNFVYLDENKCNINNWQQSGLDINQVEKNYCFNLLYSPHLTKEDFNYLIRKLDSNFLKQIDPSQIQPKELQQDQFSVPSDLSEDLSEIKNSPQVSDLEEEDYEPVLKLKDAVYESKSDYEKVYNREFFEQYPLFSDESIQALVLMACSNNLNYDVQRQLCMHPLNNYRIYDATSFLLSLRKEDYKILSENNEKDFGQFYDKEKTDKQHYIPQMTNLFFNKDNLFEKQKRKFGFPYIFRSIFTKTKNIRLLDEDFIMDREEKQENWRTLPILENARKILEQKESQNLNKKGSQKENLLNQQNNNQKINWQSFITIAQINLIEIYQSIECTPFFKDCAQLIKVSPEDNRNQQPSQTQYQQFMNQQQQFSGQKLQQQQFQQHQQLQQQQYLQQQQQQQFNLVEHFWKNIDCFQQEERKKKVQEKIYFPEVNYFKLFQNYPVIFQNFCQGSLVSIKSDIQKIIQQTIEYKPSLFRVAVKGFFSEVSETGNQVICDLIDKCVEYQEHFYKKYKSIQKEKNLEKQIDMKSYNDISSRYLVLFQSKELEYNLQNMLKYSQNFWQLFTDVILKIVYKQCKINKKHKLVQQKFKRKEKERQESESLYQQLNGQLVNMAQNHAQPQNVQNSNNIKKLQKQIAKVEAKKAQIARDIQKLLNRFYKEKNQTKQKCQEIVRESVSNLQFLNLFFRNLVEAEYMLVDFLGPNLNIDPLADGIKSLITTGWSVNLQEDDYENLEEDEDEDIFQDNAYSFPKILSKDISNTGVQGLMSNQPINTNGLPISMVKKTFSNTKDIIITLPSTFAMLFGRIYPVVQNLRELPPQIESSIFKIAIQKASQHVQFNKKLRYLKSEADKKAHQLDANVQDKKHYNIIDRAMPWTSSVQNIFFKYTIPEIIVHDVRVKFDGEPGEDWGGLRNEWLAMLNNEVFNPNYGLFAMTSNKASIYPSPYAYLIPDYLTHFRMLGRLVGKSLISNWQLYVSFSKAFLKLILGKSLYISDLEDIDPEFSKNLEFILNTEIGDDLGLNFTTSFSQFGIQKFIQLEEDGSDRFVNDENKKEYVKARCKAFLTDSIHKQTIAFRQGLNDIIPQKALSCLNENELGLHLSGMPSLDIKELQKYCQLKGGFQKDDSTIRYFFEILESFDDVMKANLLFFFTGAFKVPIDGFKNNPLRLAKINIKDRLPVAHTCFNQIDLPDYDNKEILRERLMTAIFEGHSGFHIE